MEKETAKFTSYRDTSGGQFLVISETEDFDTMALDYQVKHENARYTIAEWEQIERISKAVNAKVTTAQVEQQAKLRLRQIADFKRCYPNVDVDIIANMHDYLVYLGSLKK